MFRYPRPILTQDDPLEIQKWTIRDFEEYFAIIRPGNREGCETNNPELNLLMELYYFSLLARAHKRAPQWLEGEIGRRFEAVLCGNDWETAFPLPWSSQQPLKTGRLSRQSRQLVLALAYYTRLKPERFSFMGYDTPMSISQAKNDVAATYCVSTKTVEAALTAQRRAGNFLLWSVTKTPPKKKGKI